MPSFLCEAAASAAAAQAAVQVAALAAQADAGADSPLASSAGEDTSASAVQCLNNASGFQKNLVAVGNSWDIGAAWAENCPLDP